MDFSLFPRDLFAEMDRLTREMHQAFDLTPAIRGFARGGYPALNVVFDGLVVRPAQQGAVPHALGWSFGDYTVKDFVIRNFDIQGFPSGIDIPVVSIGTFTVEHGYLRNDTNLIRTAISNPGGGQALVPRTVVVRGVRFEATTAAAHFDVLSFPLLDRGNNVDWTLRDTFTVYDFNGVAGDNFQVFWRQQAADAIMPASDPAQNKVGAPVAGLTNQQAWDRYGIAFAGAIAPADATTRDGIDGLVKRI